MGKNLFCFNLLNFVKLKLKKDIFLKLYSNKSLYTQIVQLTLKKGLRHKTGVGE